MQEALAPLGRLGRAGIPRKAFDNARGNLDRVLDLALGKAWMGADAADCDRRLVGREGLVLQIAGALAVHRVAEVRAEFLEVDAIDSVADFLVGREQDL